MDGWMDIEGDGWIDRWIDKYMGVGWIDIKRGIYMCVCVYVEREG